MQLLAALLVPTLAAASLVNVVVEENADVTVKIAGAPWFTSTGLFFRSGGTKYDAATLERVSTSARTRGADAWGAYEATAVAWRAGGAPVVTTVRAYETFVVFEQSFPAGLNGTRDPASVDGLASGWPVLRATVENGGYVAWKGVMTGAGASVGAVGELDVAGGLEDTGPVCFFDGAHAAVVSPASNFMAASYGRGARGAIAVGVMGGVASVPAGYALETIVHAAVGGVNGAMDAWGAALLARFGNGRAAGDFTTRYLGYSTDNGAFYYYDGEPNKTMEATLLDVHAYAKAAGLPYKHVLLDSWWYYKSDDTGGVTEWRARPDVFPSVQETPRKPGVFGLWRPLSRSDSSRFGSFLDR